jgi:acyl carrier protein
LAGSVGANVLTHLLGQTIEEVATKIKVYREARAAAGYDPNTGVVSLMLHTFVGDDVDAVREIVREPMKAYLRSSVSLIKGFAWAFPAFKRPEGENASPNDIDLGSLTTEELDAILEFAFERYFETSGLFGTAETCQAMIERCRAAGVDDIACLIDFGVPVDISLAALEKLDRARQIAVARNAHGDELPASTGDYSIAAQISDQRATHLQCTPSMARMLLMEESSRKALANIKHVMIGGEAFPIALANDLASAMKGAGTITNMYGPTETTIWSSTQRVTADMASIPIGKPIANTQLYVLDERKRPVPVGVPGELYIGGDGVVRGYLHRPELTVERFVPDPFRVAAGHANARMYRTGDLARFREDGVVEFLGRADFQVKIRGYRIELGEIETQLGSHASVREAVVVAREDTPGDQRLVGYLVPKDAPPDLAELREYLLGKLPEYMVPSHLVVLERMPLTPNGKVDRKLLPAPDGGASTAKTEFVAPAGELEEQIAAAWRETLGLQKVGIQDNFFDLGGHSLLVVRLHRRLQGALPKPVSLTDLYRFPTIGSLSEFLSADPTAAALGESADRAKLRREMLDRRRRRPS